MNRNKQIRQRRLRRKIGLRKKVYGTPDKPRLTVFRSQKYIYAQVIDDLTGRTIVSASSRALDKGSDMDAATQVGKTIAEQAKDHGFQAVTFDRNGYRYHGRVKAVAEGAREAGLKF